MRQAAPVQDEVSVCFRHRWLDAHIAQADGAISRELLLHLRRYRTPGQTPRRPPASVSGRVRT